MEIDSNKSSVNPTCKKIPYRKLAGDALYRAKREIAREGGRRILFLTAPCSFALGTHLLLVVSWHPGVWQNVEWSLNLSRWAATALATPRILPELLNWSIA